jgi:hypothetical protein
MLRLATWYYVLSPAVELLPISEKDAGVFRFAETLPALTPAERQWEPGAVLMLGTHIVKKGTDVVGTFGSTMEPFPRPDPFVVASPMVAGELPKRNLVRKVTKEEMFAVLDGLAEHALRRSKGLPGQRRELGTFLFSHAYDWVEDRAAFLDVSNRTARDYLVAGLYSQAAEIQVFDFTVGRTLSGTEFLTQHDSDGLRA